jgi:hypothetical protein
MITNNQDLNAFLNKLGDYYLIPHELLHVLAFRLIGKPYHYQFGDRQVKALKKLTRREWLIILLLPVTVCGLLGLLFYNLWLIFVLSAQMPPEQYILDGPRWHLTFPVIATLFILYSGAAYGDVIWAWRILFGKDQPQDTNNEPHVETDQE